MTLAIEEQQIFMYRPDLKRIRKVTLPAGYSETPVTPDLHSGWAKVLDQVLGGIDINRPPLVESPRWRDDRAILVMKGAALLWPRVSGGMSHRSGRELGRCFLQRYKKSTGDSVSAPLSFRVYWSSLCARASRTRY